MENSGNNLDLPADLATDLADVYRAPVFVPPEVDDLVLAQSRSHLSGISRQSRWVLPGVGAAAAAAAIIVMALWWMDVPQEIIAGCDAVGST